MGSDPISAGLGILGGIQGMDAAKGQQKAANAANKNQAKITAEQMRMITGLKPLLNMMQGGAQGMIDPLTSGVRGEIDRANRYDPAKETDDIMRSYDASARDSIGADLGNASVPFSLRGLTGSSEANGATIDVLGRRASDRASTRANLELGQRERKSAAVSAANAQASGAFNTLNPTSGTLGAAGTLSGPSGAYGQMAATAQQSANGFNPAGAIGTVKDSLKGFKWPWQRTQPGPGGLANKPIGATLFPTMGG